MERSGKKTRNVPGWEDAPVPACLGGDERSLTFCCDPRSPFVGMPFNCRRDELLAKIGLSAEDFVRIKDEFSKENGWDDPRVCFGSLAYCCMRRHGCPFRDAVLAELYGAERAYYEYFRRKKELAMRILEEARRRRGRSSVENGVECE